MRRPLPAPKGRQGSRGSARRGRVGGEVAVDGGKTRADGSGDLVDGELSGVVEPLSFALLGRGERPPPPTHAAAGAGGGEPGLGAFDQEFALHRGDRAGDREDEAPGG